MRTPGYVAVEIARLDAEGHQEFSRFGIWRNGAARINVVGRNRVAQYRERPGAVDSACARNIEGYAIEEGWPLQIGRALGPHEQIALRSR